MAGLTRYGEVLFLRYAFEQLACYPSLYLGLGTGSDSYGITSEVSAADYSRSIVGSWAIANGVHVNNETIFIASDSEAFGTPDTWGIFSSESGGTALFTGPISPPKAIAANQQVYFSPGELSIEIVQGGGISSTFASTLLDHFLGLQAYTPTGPLYVGFTADSLTDTITGEVFTGGYCRQLLGTVSTAVTAEDGTHAVVKNEAAIPFTVSGDWGGSLDTLFIADHETATAAENLLFTGGITAISPVSGDIVEILIGDITITQG